MAEPAFLAMRAGLVERGLLLRQAQDGREEFCLTTAGEGYVDELLDQLPREQAPCDSDSARVRWNYRPGRRA